MGVGVGLRPDGPSSPTFVSLVYIVLKIPTNDCWCWTPKYGLSWAILGSSWAILGSLPPSIQHLFSQKTHFFFNRSNAQITQINFALHERCYAIRASQSCEHEMFPPSLCGKPPPQTDWSASRTISNSPFLRNLLLPNNLQCPKQYCHQTKQFHFKINKKKKKKKKNPYVKKKKLKNKPQCRKCHLKYPKY